MRIAGIDVHIDWSLFLIFGLIAFSLGTGVLPRWHPAWPPILVWAVALAAAVMFFGSVLLHELSHALVGRANGIPVRRITLFVFGGVAHLEREPSAPRAELLMAAVGPLTSIVIGIVATIIGAGLAGPLPALSDAPELVAAALSPLATLLLWLGPVNLMLGIFNLVPGFPLDGGRVLRAALWSATGDLMKATRWASAGGRAFGFLLMTLGVLMAFGFRVPFFGVGFGGGLWLVLIGWFLQNAARASYEQLVLRRQLAGVPVTDVMLSRVYTVGPDVDLATFVREYVMATDQASFPVVDPGANALIGVVAARHLQSVPREAWGQATVGQVMTPADRVPAIGVDAGAQEALERLATSETDHLPVVDHGALRGVVRRQDILKWLTLQPEPVG